ncbi:MAG: hypothetical protein JWO53_1296 [Chlamydiia bacterium]|nr:hypothetical protein [Chlamydiia bacterium]
MVTLSQTDLLHALQKLQLNAEVQSETNQIYLIFKAGEREFPLFIRILGEGELLQLLTFIPCSVKPAQVSDISRFLHMLNKELDVPGFCVDEATATVFYRLILSAPQKVVADETFEAFINTSQVVCKTFSPAIEAISAGAMSLEDVLKKAQEAKG